MDKANINLKLTVTIARQDDYVQKVSYLSIPIANQLDKAAKDLSSQASDFFTEGSKLAKSAVASAILLLNLQVPR